MACYGHGMYFKIGDITHVYIYCLLLVAVAGGDGPDAERATGDGRAPAAADRDPAADAGRPGAAPQVPAP